MIKLPLFVCLVLFAPVSLASKPITLSVMTFNIENGGTQVSFNKVVEAIRVSGADVVGLQETWGNTEKIAKSLQWKYYSNAQHIISRFPLMESAASHHRYLYIEVRAGYVVAMANMHLPDEPYGPTLIGEHVKVKAVLDNERMTRLPVALPYIKSLSAFAKNGMPVFLTGDFNSPSHLDWTARTLHVARNHSAVVPWVVSKTAAGYGLKDSFRDVYPDARNVPGYTWPSERPFLKDSIDGYNPSANDLPDRLDFVFYGGKARVLNSQAIGRSDGQFATIHVSPWPSDHAAVVSTFEVIPVKLQHGMHAHYVNEITHSPPTISATKTSFKSGEPVVIDWKNAPGNRYDYITIIPDGAAKTVIENAPRLYTQSKTAGRIRFDASDSKGNWPEWNKSEVGKWPLDSGVYQVRLMLDDSPEVIASTQLTIR